MTEVSNDSLRTDTKRRDARDRIVDILRRELMGPYDGAEEQFSGEYPTSRYIVGRLAPFEQAVATEENDALGVGEEEEESGATDESVPLVLSFHPSSIGLSFIVEPSCRHLDVRLTWGDYIREQVDNAYLVAEDADEVEQSENPRGGAIWQRHSRETQISKIALPPAGRLPKIVLDSNLKNAGAIISGFQDASICLEGVVHKVGAQFAVSLFVVNRRQKLELSNRNKDERWMLQVCMEVSASDNRAVFISRPRAIGIENEEAEAQSYELLYSHRKEFAAGHGVAANWVQSENHDRATKIWTDFLPGVELAGLVAPTNIAGDAILDMKALAGCNSPQCLVSALRPLVDNYRCWILGQSDQLTKEPLVSDSVLRKVAQEHLSRCEASAERMSLGLKILESDQQAYEAFLFANQAMWDQRIHSLWAQSNRKLGRVDGDPAKFDSARSRTWRPFQMGFILQCIAGIAAPQGLGAKDRDTADLLWFPTGGGKTEAYLGLSAFALALRRLRAASGGYDGAGVTILMRYTLRLLTVQQFQRASALISACEIIRRAHPKKWGREPFRIGLWVGRNTTPNQYTGEGGALDTLTRLKQGQRIRGGSPVQLFSCPRCGEMLANERSGVPFDKAYRADDAARRIIISCCNPLCELTENASPGVGIPAVVVDDEIYRLCPSLVIATVDKFAQLAYNGRTQSLFGRRDRWSETFGHLCDAHGDKIEGRVIKDATSSSTLLPPELIIQDELHLISGPLGTLVGLYETAINSLCRGTPSTMVPPKIVASTATIRRAPQQMRRLYARPDVSIFPASGVSAKDAFFAQEQPINIDDDRSAGRMYLGINAPGTSQKTLLVRVYSILLAAAQEELNRSAEIADPYATLVGYFSSLRALGGAKRLVEDDVRNVRLNFLARKRGLPQRRIYEQAHELTSRKKSWEIPSLLKLLERAFPRDKGNYPVDVLLATNMISVGVDIDRLGLMVVAGQPKSTSEYIQATSRVGRASPGLVITMYNWLGVRDLSHYERFRSYHEALYRFVEAISVTPYSSRALDRGLRGVIVSMARLGLPGLAPEQAASNFDSGAADCKSMVREIGLRARDVLESDSEGETVQKMVEAYADSWTKWAADPLRYRWLNQGQLPPNNARVLLRPSGTPAGRAGLWEAPTSLREVERAAAFYLRRPVSNEGSR
ncbi:helicase [Bradyrhizobium yuanmingense]|uniref:DISARM system helicase DrmA n=1 Tax=Bradyrhizobium yuanmingense TaxID=108015 RepID=UPI000FE425B6|nr:DISARM system helicase DrmA [Bradyrhizobium yuanmingense]TGN73465.1 helicase [Bradyrhizobium yuanmingense]